jgi:uncharacterized membrane protein
VPRIHGRSISALQGFAVRLRFTLTALVVSTFPESAKRDGWAAIYASPAAHAFSGWVETLVSAGLFVIGFLHYVGGFVNGPGWTYLSHQPGTLGYGDFFGMGALGYVSYLLTPVAWVTILCFAEGILRALDAAFSERMLGIALVVLPWRAVVAARRAAARKRLAGLLGPERPDEVVPGDEGAVVALTILAAREKPWTDQQVLEYRDDFYQVIGKRLVPRGRYHVYRYELRRFQHGEVIRGVLVRYPPEGATPEGQRPRGVDRSTR